MKDIKQALKNGEVVIGTFNIIPHPTITEILGNAGFDFLIIECEQGALSPWGTELENLIRAANAADVTPFVRISVNDRGMITKALNFGVKGIIVPHVNTKEEMIRIVEAAKYPPKGNRTAAPVIRAAKYGAIPWSEFVQRADEDVMIIPLFEEPKAFDNIEEILSVEGVDVAFFGPFDLALRLGGVGDPDAERKVLNYEERLITLCNQKNIPVMNLAWDAESVKRQIEKGCKIIAYSTDISIFNNALQREMANIKIEH